MRLLIVTQKVDKDDENLGFFHRWVEEFSRNCSGVTVIANLVGGYDLPKNVRVLSLGKEKGKSRIARIMLFWYLFFQNIRRADAVFFHMIPEFVLAASPVLLIFRKPSALWYVHKNVTRKLKLAERLVDWVFTASDLSFRLPSKKVLYTGHAIDTEALKPTYNLQPIPRPTSVGRDPGVKRLGTTYNLRLLTVGRISPVKDIETIIGACVVLKNTWGRQWTLSVVGGPLMPRDVQYLESLKKMAREGGLQDYVHFEGARPFGEIPQLYREHDIFISMSTTGSVDKSVLEAMSSGLTVITANEAFQSLLPQQYFLEKRSPEFLAERIKVLADDNRPNTALRNLVLRKHSLEKTIKKIIDVYSRL